MQNRKSSHHRQGASVETVITHHPPIRCGIVLAGGEGMRVRSFVRRLRGDDLPKQYVKFIGTRSMLEHTFYRAERLIPAERLFAVVNRNHLSHPEVGRQLASRHEATVVIQPENKDTGPGIFLPLIHVLKKYPGSTVVVFPSDHFILEEERFMEHVELACRAVERYTTSVVLLGVQPSEPEPEYGYIVPGRKRHGNFRGVRQFVEKPPPDLSRRLLNEGGLWNTMVMIFKASSMVDLVCRAAPQMHGFFWRILESVGTDQEMQTIDEVYGRMESLNFSTGLMEKFAGDYSTRMAVLPVNNVYWSDWGCEQRILNGIEVVGQQQRRRRAIPNQRNFALEDSAPASKL